MARRTAVLVEVVRREELTPHMTRIVFGGPDLEGFGAGTFTDEYVKIQFPVAGAGYEAPFDPEQVKATLPREQWPRTRTYSVRAWDPAALELTVDVVVHGDTGVAGPWAAGAKVGDRLQLAGPGGAYAPSPDADWHLFIGDPSVVPSISRALEHLPAGAPAHVFIAVDGVDDELDLQAPEGATVRWIHGGEAELEAAVAGFDFPQGDVQAFVHGEASSVRAMRRLLVVERGVPREALSISGYWKRSRTEEGWREDKAEWNRLVQEDEVATA